MGNIFLIFLQVSRSISQKIVHPRYNSATIDYDIALLKLSQPAPINSFIRTVCLPSRISYVGMVGTALGWGIDIIDEAAIALHQKVSNKSSTNKALLFSCETGFSCLLFDFGLNF